jgi:hypothetical protein
MLKRVLQIEMKGFWVWQQMPVTIYSGDTDWKSRVSRPSQAKS